MGLSTLIKDQKIIIDNHKRGTGEELLWDSPDVDINIDKKLNISWMGNIKKLE